LKRNKKIFILLPDGVGLRNFAFTQFVEIGEKLGWEIIFWNHTTFELSSLGLKEIKLNGKAKPFTDLLKRAKVNAELNYFEEIFKDPVYRSYKFSASGKGFKSTIKNSLVSFLIRKYKGEKGLRELRRKLQESERNSSFYIDCKKVLLKENPDIIFCTSQRPVNAISPITAAQDLNIPTATFIFSWDNISKATMVVQTDYYFVWSNLMKRELQLYYPYISSNQIQVSGTPQFEVHYYKGLIEKRDVFFRKHGLDLQRNYICFSGDDVTTSPDDPQYLDDVAAAVVRLNLKGSRIGIVFRRCPVDFSGRYNSVLEKYKEIIIEITPLWERQGDQWNTVLPLKEDIALQINTLYHSLGVINLGSTMIFDAVAHCKPCFYINYDVKHKKYSEWSTSKIYKYVHFRSMPSKNSVIWLNSKEEIEFKILDQLNRGEKINLKEAKQWFRIINEFPAENASQRIWTNLNKIIE
jgi:hypothetical protein